MKAVSDDKTLLCLPIQETDPRRVIKVISNNLENYDLFEVWLGALKEVNKSFVEELIKCYSKRLILLFRKEALKINFDNDLARYICFLANQANVMVDLDIKLQRSLLDFSTKKRITSNLIVSYHNYQETPKAASLSKILGDMLTYAPKICKFSTFCNSNHDIITLLNLAEQMKRVKCNKVILGMGEKGIVTRILPNLFRSKILFVPKKTNKTSAPGQISLQKLKRVWSELDLSRRYYSSRVSKD
jgi:3-dehydroquinate dehydratase type I